MSAPVEGHVRDGSDRPQNGQRSARRGRGRGGGKHEGSTRQGSFTRQQPPPGLPNGDKLTAQEQPKTATTKKEVLPVEDDTDAEVCFICAEPIQYSAITACNHRTCHICALRLRALYKNNFCAYCKTESKTVLFTLPSEKLFTDYGPDDIAAQDIKLGISFEKPVIMEETMILLHFNCPVDTCDVSAAGWPDLKVHIKQAHNQLLCDLCVKNKKVFTHEHDLFSKQGLTSHFKDGNRNTEDDDGFKGHPECGFCRKAFYDDDELYKHCRDKHERCHVCDQLDNGPGRAQYFQDYAKLDQHFRREHYVCPDPVCLEQKFVVFGSELDLKAHQLEAHPNGMSGQALRSARKINTTFAGYEGPANARGNRRGQPDIQFQSSNSSTAHMSREQQALQRQFEYQQSMAQRSGFGTALSDPDPAPAPPPQAAMQVPVPSPAVQRAPPIEAFPALGGAGGSTITKSKIKKNDRSAANTSAAQATKSSAISNGNSNSSPDVSKHQAILDRVSMAASYDAEKVALFKTNMAQFRSTNISAPELIQNLHSLLHVSLEVLGGLVTSAADVLDSDARRVDLLTAWNDWKLKHASDASAPTAGQRILSIKNRASRTANQTSSVWSSTASSSSFAAASRDPIGQAAHRLAQMQMSGRGKSHYTPAWSGSAANSGTATPASTSASMEFPSLPMGTRRRVDTSKYFSNGWGNHQVTSGPVIGPDDYESVPEDVVVPAQQQGQGKGKKKVKKQLLFSQGLQRG